MMTSSNGNIFRVTDTLCGEFTGTGEFPVQRPVTRSFDVFFDLRPNKRLSKQWWSWWFETPSWSLWRQCNGHARKQASTLSYSIEVVTCTRIHIHTMHVEHWWIVQVPQIRWNYLWNHFNREAGCLIDHVTFPTDSLMLPGAHFKSFLSWWYFDKNFVISKIHSDHDRM